MDVLTHHFSNINWWAVVVAALASYVVGGIWYAPPVLGNRWMKLLGLKKKDMQGGNMVFQFGLSGVLALVMAVGLATLMCALDFTTVRQGAFLGFLVALVFVSANRGVHSLFERKGGFELFVINMGHDVAYFALAGAIIGAF